MPSVVMEYPLWKNSTKRVRAASFVEIKLASRFGSASPVVWMMIMIMTLNKPFAQSTMTP